MNIGLSTSVLAYSSSSFWTSFLASFHVSITLLNLSSLVIKPRVYCLLIVSTILLASSIIFPLFLLVVTSATDTVIPAIVEYLKPKSLSLSSIIEVSVVL